MTFYFAWVNATDTTWSDSFKREDEKIESFQRVWEEGQIPYLELVIKNPRIGFLNASRKQWAWFAWQDAGGTTHPLFFGRLLAVPLNFEQNRVTVRLIARANDFIIRKATVAETLKVAPWWDPIFADDNQLVDPDYVLEAYAAAWYINPLDLSWDISNILVGEAGTIEFTENEVVYDSVRPDFKAVPLRQLKVVSKVQWDQVDSGGAINLGLPYGGFWRIKTYTGGSLIADWPRPGASLGGGWYAGESGAFDISGLEYSHNISLQSSMTIEGPHIEGDTLQATSNASFPSRVGTNPIKMLISEEGQGGIVGGDGPNIPNFSYSGSWSIIPSWDVVAWLHAQYRADRKRSEVLTFTIDANLQYTLSDPLVTEETDVESIDAAVDLSQPRFNVKNWTILAGNTVKIGQYCKPNNPSGAGGTSYQIALSETGVCGSTEPLFSDIVGVLTFDGTVTWVCVGEEIQRVGDWQAASSVGLGTVVAPIPQIWNWYSAYWNPFSISGVDFSEGTIIRSDLNGSFQMCIVGGTSSVLFQPAFSPVYGVITFDGTCAWISLGTYVPLGGYQICVQAGITNLIYPPPFSLNYLQAVNDGTAIWKSLGMGDPSIIEIPVGGIPGRTVARDYFPSDRGVTSIENLLLRARAKVLTRARALETEFTTTFAAGVPVTLKHNVKLDDHRLPGGTISGKVIKHVLRGDGTRGDFATDIVIGSAVGLGGTATGATGNGTYVDIDYVGGDYQEIEGETVLAASSDIGYVRPLHNPKDDGLTFPLDYSQVVLANIIHNNYTLQQTLINAQKAAHSIRMQQLLTKLRTLRMGIGYNGSVEADVEALLADLTYTADNAMEALEIALSAAGAVVYPEIVLKPLTGNAYTTTYVVTTTPLEVISQVNLEAPSNA